MSRQIPSERGEAGAGRDDRGARRVTEIHARTRIGLVQATAFVAAGSITGLLDVGGGWWVGLHLFTVGGLLGAIATVTLMLAVTWSAAPAPARWITEAQRGLVGAGAVGLAVGRTTATTWLVGAGAAAVALALGLLAAALVDVRRRAVTPRFAPAIDAYLVALVAGASGTAIGAVIGIGQAGDRWAELRAAHLVLNVFGLVGLVIAGTLPFFAATQLRSKMSARATPRAVRATVGVLALGTALAAAGALGGRSTIHAGGLGLYATGLVALAFLLPAPTAKRLDWAGPRALQLLAGLGWWIACTVALAAATLDGGADRVILRTLVIGGFAHILIASLAYLAPVLRGGGHQRLTAGFAVTRSMVSLVVGNLAALASALDQTTLMGVALGIWVIDLVVRWVGLTVPRTPPT